MKAKWFVYAGLVLLLVFVYRTHTRHMISAERAKELIRTKKVDVVLDVRNKDELEKKGFYPGSVNIPMDVLETELPKRFPDTSTRILVYCATGKRARIATDAIQNLGYANTVFITGTYTALLT